MGIVSAGQGITAGADRVTPVDVQAESVRGARNGRRRVGGRRGAPTWSRARPYPTASACRRDRKRRRRRAGHCMRAQFDAADRRDLELLSPHTKGVAAQHHVDIANYLLSVRNNRPLDTHPTGTPRAPSCSFIQTTIPLSPDRTDKWGPPYGGFPLYVRFRVWFRLPDRMSLSGHVRFVRTIHTRSVQTPMAPSSWRRW